MSETSAPKPLRVAVAVDFRGMADQLHAAADSLHPASARGPAAVELSASHKKKQAENLLASLNSGEQPDSIAGYVGQAIGAAGSAAPFGPGTGTYRDDLASVVLEWAVAGISRLIGNAPETPRPKRVGYGVVVFPGDGGSPWFQGGVAAHADPARPSPLPYLIQRSRDAARLAQAEQQPIRDGGLAVAVSLVPFETSLADLLAAGAGAAGS